MAITRRQFVTRLGTLAAAMGMSQADFSKVAEAFAHGNTLWATKKPKVLWVHGAECTGCSTSVLGLFEDAAGQAVENTALTGGNKVSTLTALQGIAGGDLWATSHRTLNAAGADFDKAANAGADTIVNIADVLIDFIDLQYHETVMGMGGDLAYQFLLDQKNNSAAGDYFVLVVEGAVQPKNMTAAWAGQTTGTPWCSIAKDGTAGADVELSFDDVVWDLARSTKCVASISIGQCACFGGYPGCVSPKYGKKQTPAMGVGEFLAMKDIDAGGGSAVANKVINVPGCPTNPWWFILTVVLWMFDAVNGPGKDPVFTKPGPLGILDTSFGIKAGAVDSSRRLKAVYGASVHSGLCPRYNDYTAGKYATKPGDSGCLRLLGCKGPSTKSLCSLHGWNGQQPRNTRSWDQGVGAVHGVKGGFCVSAGHPCMGCTEKGYPDSFVPFVRL